MRSRLLSKAAGWDDSVLTDILAQIFNEVALFEAAVQLDVVPSMKFDASWSMIKQCAIKGG